MLKTHTQKSLTPTCLHSLPHYYDLGFSLLWLKPRSKSPFQNNWTKLPRAKRSELEARHKSGFNLGVRLGHTSIIEGKYLAVVDCDVKSTKPHHKNEMLAKLAKLVKNYKSAPCCLSGRGNGSRHYYFLTDKPVSPRRLSQSSELVRTYMPSVAPTRRDNEKLSSDDVKQGYRIRPAWELSLMGEGQQVVLPPSVHPDSKRPYTWRKGIRPEKDSIPILKLAADSLRRKVGEPGANREVSTHDERPVSPDFQFTPVDVDLSFSNLSDAQIDTIKNGSSDNSASLFSVTMAMLRADFSRDEILSVLTNKDYRLGQTAYEHAKTNNRKRAARWIEKYTLKKAKAEVHALKDFLDENGEIEQDGPPLSEEEATVQAKKVKKMRPWQARLERTRGEDSRVKNTLGNARLIFTNAIAPDFVRFDEFKCRNQFVMKTPWGDKPGDLVTDKTIVRAKCWIADNYRVEFPNDRISEALVKIASDNSFHPVRDYLEGIFWDGKPRVDTWLKKYLCATGDDNYLAAVGRKFLVAMVARVMKPGIKFDQVLILEGIQGCGKSSTARILGGDWYTDSPLMIGDKDAVVTLQGQWVVELGELSAMRKAEVETLKAFISQNVDKIRPPYGAHLTEYPRQCVFIGTTNNDEYLKDTTGNRRFWPVQVGEADLDALKEDREQLLAEALVILNAQAERLYLDSRELNTLAVKAQNERVVYDDLIDMLGKFFAAKPEEFTRTPSFSMSSLFDIGGPFEKRDMSPMMCGRIKYALKAIGFTEKRTSTSRQFFWPEKLRFVVDNDDADEYQW